MTIVLRQTKRRPSMLLFLVCCILVTQTESTVTTPVRIHWPAASTALPLKPDSANSGDYVTDWTLCGQISSITEARSPLLRALLKDQGQAFVICHRPPRARSHHKRGVFDRESEYSSNLKLQQRKRNAFAIKIYPVSKTMLRKLGSDLNVLSMDDTEFQVISNSFASANDGIPINYPAFAWRQLGVADYVRHKATTAESSEEMDDSVTPYVTKPNGVHGKQAKGPEKRNLAHVLVSANHPRQAALGLSSSNARVMPKASPTFVDAIIHRLIPGSATGNSSRNVIYIGMLWRKEHDTSSPGIEILPQAANGGTQHDSVNDKEVFGTPAPSDVSPQTDTNFAPNSLSLEERGFKMADTSPNYNKKRFEPSELRRPKAMSNIYFGGDPPEESERGAVRIPFSFQARGKDDQTFILNSHNLGDGVNDYEISVGKLKLHPNLDTTRRPKNCNGGHRGICSEKAHDVTQSYGSRPGIASESGQGGNAWPVERAAMFVRPRRRHFSDSVSDSLKRGFRACNSKRLSSNTLLEFFLTGKMCGSNVVRMRFGIGRR